MSDVMEEFDLAKALKVEDYLKKLSYEIDPNYIPSDFALHFVAFIKLIHGVDGTESKTPVMHYHMLDTLVSSETRIANLCHRGSAKTTLLAQYLFLYIAVYGELPMVKNIVYALYVSDSMENGVKKMRLRLEQMWDQSLFLQEYLPTVKFTDIRWYFKNADGREFVVTGHGAKALALDTVLYTDSGTTTIGNCSPGDKIIGADGKLTTILAKSELFTKQMYQIDLADGRSLNVSEDHLNSVLKYGCYRVLTTAELLEVPLFRNKPNGTRSYTLHIVNCAPIEFSEKVLPVSPYVLGLLLGDGSIKKDGSVTLHGHIDDIPEYLPYIPYRIGSSYLDKRNNTVRTISLLNAYKDIDKLGIRGKTGEHKEIPESYFFGSIRQRLDLLQGLLDTDGTISKEGKVTFCSTSPNLVDGVIRLVRSLGGTAKKWQMTQKLPQHACSWKVGIWLNLPCFKLPRKLIRCKQGKSLNVAITGITPIPLEASQCIAVDNELKEFLVNDYVRTHNTGVRGTVELNSRPQLAVLDDLLSDEDARSPTIIASVEDTVYKAITYALHPQRNAIIWSGTPFNAKDPLYKAVESGAWAVNVFPICEHFPCTRKEFRGSWADRFDYDYVKQQYEISVKTGTVSSFNQELMLRIMSDEDRLVLDSEIQWYRRTLLIQNKNRFNFYITTDFATSEKESSDYSVISVWAYNNTGEWFWVDGVCKRQLMDKNVDDLFRLAQMYKPQQVGVEISGQQKGFISWLQSEMLRRNNYFTLASENNQGQPGIRPNTNKMARFNIVLPWIKTGRVKFPEELKSGAVMLEAMDELGLAAPSGFRSKHDDFIDTISMLASLTPWKPSDAGTLVEKEDGIWELEDDDDTESYIDSYIV